MKNNSNLRRKLLTLLAFTPLFALPAHAQKAGDTVRIGYQKSRP